MKPVAMTVAPFDTLAELRFERDVRHLHRLGERGLGEFLREVSQAHGIRTSIDMRLADCLRVDPEFLRALRGDHFPVLPLHEVWR